MKVENFLGVADVAERLGCTVGRVRQLLGMEKKLKGHKINERAWLISTAEVERYIEERERNRRNSA